MLTDHANLHAFMTTKELSRQQACWAEWLAAFDFVIEYRKGVSNPSDDPSCWPDYEQSASIENDGNIILPIL